MVLALEAAPVLRSGPGAGGPAAAAGPRRRL